jgi:uncharacterized protein (DUF1778 family)
MLLSSYRIPRRDDELIVAACASAGISRSEFMRTALRQVALKMIAAQQRKDTKIAV